jgi:hypothetical protein
MRRIRSHLTYANVMATIAVFLVVSGGTAVALSGSNTVFTDDIANDTRPASGGNPAGGLAAADLRPNSVGGSEAANESLTGADIANKSGVDSCVNTIRLGDLCFRAENSPRPWTQAAGHCANLNLRLPTYGEARALARTYDLPNVDQGERFWTDETVIDTDGEFQAFLEYDAGSVGGSERGAWTNSFETVCVTTPTN